MESVKAVLPACKPIIVTDAGFRTPWMKLVLSYGWDYICRVRGLNLIRSAKDEAWCDVERLWKMTSAGPSQTRLLRDRPKVTVSHSYRRRPEEAEIPATSREARLRLRAAEASRTRAMDSRNVADRVGQEGGHDVRAPHADRGDVSRHEKPPLRDRPESRQDEVHVARRHARPARGLRACALRAAWTRCGRGWPPEKIPGEHSLEPTGSFVGIARATCARGTRAQPARTRAIR